MSKTKAFDNSLPYGGVTIVIHSEPCYTKTGCKIIIILRVGHDSFVGCFP